MARSLSQGVLFFLLAALSLAGITACRREDNLPETGTALLKPVHLSLSVGARPLTKMDVSTSTELSEDAPVFRGLTDIKMMAFDKGGGAVAAEDQALAAPIVVPSFSELNTAVSAYFYPSGIDTFLPMGTSAMLLYARAPGDDKQVYGSLIPHGFDTEDTHAPASSLGFTPDVMYPMDETPAEAQLIARVVNTIMLGESVYFRVTYRPKNALQDVDYWVYVNWNEEVEDVNLRQAYLQITNEGAVIPGSGPMVESMLSSMYSFFRGYESHNENPYELTLDGEHYQLTKEDGQPLLYKDILNRLRDRVLNRFTSDFASQHLTVDAQELTVRFTNPVLSAYPESMGLPSGCAILRWTPAGFVVPRINGVEGMAPISRYCYPTSLYYYIDTDIVTSQDKDIADSYTSRSSWAEVIQDYTLGTSITSNTTSVALVKPLHFAVSMLSATVQSDRDWLQDNDDLPETTVAATGENLPVTGIILSGQYAQNYNFTPVSGADEYFSYDNLTPGVYVTKQKSAPIRTLSLPTPEGKDIYFTLEFLNNSGKTFFGSDGRVLPGRKFYMVGKMELPTDPEKRLFEQIFVSDCVTTLNCTIHSLAGAYNAVPDLGIPQLVVGVQTKINWELSTPATLMLE